MQNKRHQTLIRLQKRSAKLQDFISAWNQKIQKYQQARLLVALLFCFSLFPLAMNEKERWGYFISAVLIALFLTLVYRTRRFVSFRDSLQLYLLFTQRQIQRISGLSSGRPWKSAHEKAQAQRTIPDLGLTGSHSLWTLLDETLTEGGQDRLLSWFQQRPTSIATILKRQQQVKALRPLSWFYTKLGLTLETQELQATKGQLLEFLAQPTIDNSFNKILLLNFLVWIPTSIAMLITYLKIVTVPNWILLIFPLVSWLSLGSVAAVFSKAVGISHYLSVLNPLLKSIEVKAQGFSALKEVFAKLLEIRPSKLLGRLERILGFLGTQTNPLLHFVVNAFFPWTLLSVYFLEKTRKEMATGFPKILQELSDFEVIGCLLIFDKFQTQNFPTFENQAKLEFQNLFHPLIDQTKVISNSFKFQNVQNLGLLTGSNMSGKSTFLRTVGLNQILANMGAPIFADSMSTYNYQVETCIEVSDSLRDGYSYFYSEVRRLKVILENSTGSAQILFLIDEIFRGTNNRERQIGSRSVITQLARSKNSVGFVSTHDLELTTLSDDVQSVINLHFKESIDSNGKMSFSYELNPGPCPTTNALRIMESEGILIGR